MKTQPSTSPLAPPKPIWATGFVHVGMPVWWRPNASRDYPPQPAIVMVVDDTTLDLRVYDRVYDKMMLVEGVKHVDNGFDTPMRKNEVGGWEHTPTTHALFKWDPEFATFPEERAYLAKKKALEGQPQTTT